MSIDQTKFTREAGSVSELNKYLQSGWVLLLSYVELEHDTQRPRFVVGWQCEDQPIIPEFLDGNELAEIYRQKNR